MTKYNQNSGKKTGKKKGGPWIVFGMLLLCGALSLTLYNYWDGIRAERASAKIQEQLDDALKDKDLTAAPIGKKDDTEEVDERVLMPDSVKIGDAYQVPEMPVITIEGYNYIGTLEIPGLNLRLPVMDHWDYDRLKISPCRYSGSYFTGDLVICAHNYQRHFSPIKTINLNESVYFITADKVVYEYIVSNRQTVQPTAIDQMIDNRNNSRQKGEAEDWDLTLFTCNTGGQTRCAVRCVRNTKKSS